MRSMFVPLLTFVTIDPGEKAGTASDRAEYSTLFENGAQTKNFHASSRWREMSQTLQLLSELSQFSFLSFLRTSSNHWGLFSGDRYFLFIIELLRNFHLGVFKLLTEDLVCEPPFTWVAVDETMTDRRFQKAVFQSANGHVTGMQCSLTYNEEEFKVTFLLAVLSKCGASLNYLAAQ